MRPIRLFALPLFVLACSAPMSASADPATAATPVDMASRAVKTPIRGLISMGSYSFVGDVGEPTNTMDKIEQKPGLLRGVVIVATWRNLEPTADGGIAPDNEIYRGLANVRAYNARHPEAPLSVKLRVWGGYFAPQWVMDQTGGAIHVIHTNNHHRRMPRVLGHVWREDYRTDWRHLQELLAAKYDAEPLIHEVAVTSCMMFTAEPFSIDTSPEALDPLRTAGLTDRHYKECLNGIVEDYRPWRTTRFETPLNPFKDTDGGHARHDEAFTLAWMQRCHAAEPTRCAFDNHDLDATVDHDLETIYDHMKNSGAEVEFQSGPEMPPNLDGMIRRGVDAGATSIELYQDYQGFPLMSDADLRRYGQMLENNRR